MFRRVLWWALLVLTLMAGATYAVLECCYVCAFEEGKCVSLCPPDGLERSICVTNCAKERARCDKTCLPPDPPRPPTPPPA